MKDEQVIHEFNVDNCRVCIDINEWKRRAQKAAFRSTDNDAEDVKKTSSLPVAASTLLAISSKTENDENDYYKQECPPDSMTLGGATWTFLHTMAAYYPDEPTTVQQSNMTHFIRLFSTFYPCGYCAAHMRKELEREAPRVNSRSELVQWFCRLHNEVNERLGKPLFDCSKVDERWRDGPKDGSCV